jgi:integrase
VKVALPALLTLAGVDGMPASVCECELYKGLSMTTQISDVLVPARTVGQAALQTWTPEPSPGFDVHKLLAPRKTHDSFQQRPLRGEGSLAGAEAFVCKQYRDDIRKQICVLCTNEFPAGTGRLRSLGFARRAAIRRIMLHLVDVLDACAKRSGDPSLRLRNTTEFRVEHLLAILRSFGEEKLKLSTVHNYLSVLRKFFTQLGRRHLIPCTDDLVLLVIEHDVPLHFGCRSYTAYVPRCWSAMVNVDAVLQRIRQISEHAHLLCLLCLAFGLRASEVLRLRPVESDLGDHLWVRRGPKGNRERFVPFSSDPQQRAEQRAALEQAKSICGGDPNRYLGFGERNLEQARKYFELAMQRCGVTQTQLGIMIHGLRHEYAVRRFMELTGLPAPVLRQAPLHAYLDRMELVRRAQKQIAVELGHGRASVASAYIGSLSTLREEAKRASSVAQTLGQYRADLQSMQVAALTVVVTRTAAQAHSCTFYVLPTAAGASKRLAATVRGAARDWLQQEVSVLLQPAPARAGAVTVPLQAA